MNIINSLLKDINIPRFVKVKQSFEKKHLEKSEIKNKIFLELNKLNIQNNLKNKSIAVTCGSRGIANINIITKSVCEFIENNGGNPFVIPAMGSHGGATAKGQKNILEKLGVTEEYLGFPIKATMKTVKITSTEKGKDVFIDEYANAADGIFVVGRIKAHTAFQGKYESGLMKMMTIGLGKQHGAEIVHEAGFGKANETIPEFGNAIIKSTNIIGALGIIENAYDQTYDLVALRKEDISKKEPELLIKANELLGKLHLRESDSLIVKEIGKNISGSGMDPNITGSFPTPFRSGGLKKQVLVALDLTKESNGNFNGLGAADITTKKVLDKIILEETYPNALTSTVLSSVKIPMIMPNDELAIKASIKCCNNINKKEPKIIIIKNTLEIGEIEVSEALIPEVIENKKLEISSEIYDLKFTEGNLK